MNETSPGNTRGKEQNNKRKSEVALLSIGTGVFLAVSKFAFALFTGSLGILSSAIDNVGDIFMSTVTFISVKKSSAPPDKSHPYGHGKVETLASAFTAFVVTAIGAWIIYESVLRFLLEKGPQKAEAGIGIMVFSVAASFLVARKIEKVGRETESPVLIADALHYKTDVYSGTGILIALVLVKVTGNPVFDSLAGLAIGIVIIRATIPLFRGVLDDLLDRELPEEVTGKINAIIDRHRPMVFDVHALRTRKAGSTKHIDFHLVVCRMSTVEQAHSLASHLEMEIEDELGDAHVVTHIEPCEAECPMKGECETLRTMMVNLRKPREGREQEKYFLDD